jgi:hypothetical protein
MAKGTRVPGSAGDKGKADRLAAALRANLKRRKAQARAKTRTPHDRGAAEIRKP